MKRRRFTSRSGAFLLIAVLALSTVLGGCGSRGGSPDSAQTGTEDSAGAKEIGDVSETSQDSSQDSSQSAGQGEDGSEAGNGNAGDSAGAATESGGSVEAEAMELSIRKSPLEAEQAGITVDVAAVVQPYTVNADLSNVENLDQFYLEDGVKELLARNGFSVDGTAGNEFFEIYENNRYENKPSFVTVDSLMHTYHLFFSHLMKNLEKGYLSDNLSVLSSRMLSESASLYDSLKGTDWETAAGRCLLLFGVGAKLMDDGVELPADVNAAAEEEIGKILNAEGMSLSGISARNEDYTQYIPRGYYEGDEQLERYFRTMMLYGRMHFEQGDDDSDKAAVLITKLFAEDEEAYRLWQSIYDVTAFFAGKSDDPGIDQYLPVYQKAYGNVTDLAEMTGDADAFSRFRELASYFAPPAVNAVPSGDGGDSAKPGFRLMGQRFSIDAAVMQLLVDDSTPGRVLPDVLDVPAALGSEKALAILDETGSSNYEGYAENMESLREKLSDGNDVLWTESLYSGWLDTLRPLLEEKGEGYPMFMQNDEWAKKDLECFAGSYTELKHDTVLYTKQVIAEMGGGYEEYDDRGYVEPEPSVYARFEALSERTAKGLEVYGLLNDADRENLSRLSQIAETLKEISVKELTNEVLTDEEYEFIRSYGGTLEHFWIELMQDLPAENGIVATRECPAAVVVDVATGYGQVLELGTDIPSTIHVIVNVDGKLKIAQGSVYSFYQFAWPADDRLTDGKWREMRGINVNAEGYFEKDPSATKPEWTLSYRYQYSWE